jgi:protein phosphatase 1G
MGNYLQDPILDKQTTDVETKLLKIGSSGMQGWRRRMEDASTIQADISEGVSLVGVFDGHGGSEISTFCSKHFSEFLLKTEGFSCGNYEQALSEAYLLLDEGIISGEYDEELESYYIKPDGV